MTLPRPQTLLLFMILVWGISWPAIKIGVSVIPPLWFGILRYAIASACLFAFVAMQGKLRLPAHRDWRLVITLATLQLAVFAALTGIALTILPPGRASVLAYTTPLWVAPLSVWFLSEPMTRRRLGGIVMGLAGIAMIIAPSIQLQIQQDMSAYAMLLAAAASWAMAIVYVKRHPFVGTPLELAPWQMALAAVILAPVAVYYEGTAALRIDAASGVALLYVSLFATAFAYWAVVEVGRHLEAGTLSIALMGVPAIGLLISSLVFNETITPLLLGGMVSIAIAIWLEVKFRSVSRDAQTK